MAVDFNAIAANAVQNLQTYIDKLNILKVQPGANIVALVAQIESLQAQQANFRTLALVSAEESPANQTAIAAVNAAATNLKHEAGNIASLASALTTAARVVGCATDLAKAFAPFVV